MTSIEHILQKVAEVVYVVGFMLLLPLWLPAAMLDSVIESRRLRRLYR